MNDALQAELESLLFDWETGELSDAGIARFREILRNDAEAQKWYVQQQMLSAALSLEGETGTLASEPETDVGKPEPKTSAAVPGMASLRRWSLLAVALLLSVLSARLIYLEVQDRPVDVAATDDVPEGRELTSRGIALVTRLVDVEWSASQQHRNVGEALSPGLFTIDRGFAQLEFFCGATVVLEGPAELELKSADLARVVRGRLRAQVPPAARGFSLEADGMKVVDLGTEFGLSVSESGANVQVFDGEVEVHSPQTAMQSIRAGQAISRGSGGVIETTELSPEDFVDIAALETRGRDQTVARYSRWQSAAEVLRSDPRLITYYTFEQHEEWQRRLQCSLRPVNSELDGAIVGTRRVVGRWPTKHGLEFKHPADRVRVQIPGEFGSLTFAAWVKIDSLDRQYNSLFLTDNYNQGEPHWQILDTGQLFFSVRSKPDDAVGKAAKKRSHHVVLSPPFWEPSMSGRWSHLATTYDVETGRVVHYLNGSPIHSELIPAELKVDVTRIGAATIGNWSLPTRPDEEFAVRNLNGSIDEFILFAAALSADEVVAMYKDGQP